MALDTPSEKKGFDRALRHLNEVLTLQQKQEHQGSIEEKLKESDGQC